jgi:hypothetical protein
MVVTCKFVLNDVKYISELERNLLSLSMFVSRTSSLQQLCCFLHGANFSYESKIVKLLGLSRCWEL